MMLIKFSLTNLFCMAGIMNLKTIVNKPSRNGFDLQTKRNFTAKVGELLPVWASEVLPGDVYNIDVNSVARLQPVNSPAYARINEYFDFYFVPYHVLWNRANEVLSQMDFNQQHSTGFGEIPAAFSGELPFVTTNQIGSYIRTMKGMSENQNNFFGYARADLSCKLLEYLGYGNFETFLNPDSTTLKYNVDVNVLPLLAYQKIYSDYFRDQQWEKPNPSTFNVDYLTGSTSMNLPLEDDSDTPFYQNYNMFDLRYCNWEKDLFHGLLPASQYGETSVVPLSGSSVGQLSITGNGSPTFRSESGNFGMSPAEESENYWYGGKTGSEGVPDSVPYPSSIWQLMQKNGATPHPAFWNDPALSLSSSTGTFGLSILALRQYEFLQKWKEIAQAGPQDYKSITKRIWNVDVPDALSDRCQYLGGFSGNLSINEVVNNNITDGAAASIVGKGYGQAAGKISFKSDNQYGIIMCIYHATPRVDYTVDYIAPYVTRVNAEDFANPVFDRVGMESISALSLLQQPAESNDPAAPPIIGYAPRYITYKTDIDLSVGAFKRSLDYYVVSYNAKDVERSINSATDDQMIPVDGYQGSFSYPFFKVNPNMVDPILTVKADSSVDTDQILISSSFDVKAVRNLDVDGLPY